MVEFTRRGSAKSRVSINPSTVQAVYEVAATPCDDAYRVIELNGSFHTVDESYEGILRILQGGKELVNG